MSARHYGRRGYSGHRPTPPEPEDVALAFTPADAWNVEWSEPPADVKAEVFLKDVTATPVAVASTTTAAGAAEADLTFTPVGGHIYQASVRFSLNGEPGLYDFSNTVTP